MRIVIQRVSSASVTIKEAIKSEIGLGFLVLLGVETEDNQEDADYLIQKLIQLRVFSDTDGKMNLSISDVKGDIIIVSQFTLHASTKKGNRPSYIRAARPEQAIPLYEYFIQQTQSQFEGKVLTGEFGADMKVNLVNDGPVTILMDSKQKD
ncbi:MAG: D-tyrosyl-tRNA(Tyr) deacylase [Flavobacteriales bacterium]|jgi:D-tyrosyl-tRNA(Tyr) deacylase|nr:D-tyrosyl-tRNA(Tyr) deacylase [Crocinitomicaceae bacterium]NBX79697.1 D-tyrosyl-tRNA(Tyr) deacylase [Flavobacteriales bacterium]NCA19644.1 D-tyrosyl-tRNA(Tyr) deacylase [Crocinitomicaceae bacterium]